MFCLSIVDVQLRIGEADSFTPERICLPYMNVNMYIGDETPFTWPPDVLREAATGAPLLTPDGTPLLVAGP